MTASKTNVGRPRKDVFTLDEHTYALPPRTPGIFLTMSADNVIGAYPAADMHKSARRMCYLYKKKPTTDMHKAMFDGTFSFKVAFDMKDDVYDADFLKHVLDKIYKVGFGDWMALNK